MSLIGAYNLHYLPKNNLYFGNIFRRVYFQNKSRLTIWQGFMSVFILSRNSYSLGQIVQIHDTGVALKQNPIRFRNVHHLSLWSTQKKCPLFSVFLGGRRWSQCNTQPRSPPKVLVSRWRCWNPKAKVLEKSGKSEGSFAKMQSQENMCKWVMCQQLGDKNEGRNL